MSHTPHQHRRIVRYVVSTLGVLLLSAGPAMAASPDTPTSQPVTRLAQAQTPAQTDPTPRKPPAQDVSDALGQRLDRMLSATKSAQPR